ncbi:MAG TPA: EAL domain-containing protein [Mycobacteriales bacterium]|nr:EAL domain-containing protein [Mycobacteriales bacterium]
MSDRLGQPEWAAGAVRFAGRYGLGPILKSGSGVDTVLAVDTHTGRQVVLKSIDPSFVHAAARLRFEHETRVLRELTGVGLTGLLDSGYAEGRLFLVQPFVPGTTLEAALRRGRLGVEAALRVGVDVATALDIAHGAGICHRDIKPANVVVDGTDPVSSVTLIDFGFARSPSLDESIRDDLVGTVRYLAPEAAGLVGAPADERSDLYALGVLLFECLAGRPPFLGPGVGEMLRQHLSMPVPDLPGLGIAVPGAVDAVIQRLLRKEPGERYQSASALAADLSELLAAVQGGEADPRIVIGRLDQRRNLADPAFVGRAAEIESLTLLVDAVAAGSGGLVLLEADSGGGKSRLLAEITRMASQAGCTVLQGQGVARGAQRPFTLLDGIAQGLAVALEADVEARAELISELGNAAPAVARALPSLSGLLGVAPDEDAGPEQFGEQRSVGAIQQMLVTVASARRPVLLVLDDCQWADGLTVRLLRGLSANRGQPTAYLGVIAAFRSEEVPADHPLRSIARPLRLGPLPPESMVMLAESMAGPVPREALDTLVRLADGNPFMGAAVLRGLVECGALTGTPEGWVVDEPALKDVQTARRSAAFLVSRLELLSAEALGLLSAGAVLGKEFDIAAAVALAGDPDDAAAIIEDARSRRLLWVDDRSGHCSFSHDKIREALLDRLSEDARRELHGRAADALANGNDGEPVPVFDLAYHLSAAGRDADALPYALAGASLARAQYALDAAVVHYRMAARGLDPADEVTRIQVCEGLGDVLTLQGAYAEAQTQLGAARSLVDDPTRAAALDGKLGDLAFKQGDVPVAKRHLEAALARLGRPIPRHPVLTLVRLSWELAVQTVHSILPRLTVGRRCADGRDEDFLAMRLYSRLAYVYWFHSGKVPCAWAHLRGMNLAERYPPSAELGQAYSEHAPVMTMLPWYGRGVKYAERSLEIRRQLDDVWGQGQSLGFAGVVLYAASRYTEAMAACREAVRLLERTGDRWEVNTAGWHIAFCLYRTGELAEAADVAREVLGAAQAIGDQAAAGIALSVWARARGGRIDGRLIDEQLAGGSEDAHTTCELQLASGLRLLDQGDLDAAAAALEAAMTTAGRAGLRQEYVAPIYPWYATVQRRLAEAAPAHNPALRSARIRRAASASRRSRRWAFTYRNNAPHALREAGLVASLRGRRRRAERLLGRSLRTAEEQGAQFELALTRLALAELAMAGGGSQQPHADALAAIRRFEPPDEPISETDGGSGASVSLFDRFTTLLKVGRMITAATSRGAVEAAIREAALTLLRGERCHLVPVAALHDEQLITQSGEAVDEISRTLLRRAVELGAPVVAGEPGTDDCESLLLSGIRSVLAAPIAVDGEPVSCFYVTHGKIGQLFGDEEVQLAAFIATLAGAAFEHLAGSETRFRSLAQNSSDVITLVDRDGVVSYQSAAATRVFALPAPGLLGQPITDWVHPDDLTRFTEALATAADSEGARIECRFRHSDGSYRSAETAVTNLLDEPTVAALVLNTRDVTDRRRLEDELRERALHDTLTGLPNRALFLDRARQALDRGRRQPMPIVVAFLDLDDFKAVNDTFGHGVGDELLRAMADRLVRCVRPADTVARFGGDEFAILLENTELATAVAIIERILDVTAVPVALANTQVVVHTSIGIAHAEDPTANPDQLLAHADAAMYAAKARGKHCFDLFVPAMQAATETRSRLRTELDRALIGDEFRLHYQPILDLRSGGRVGVEALIRWEHGERGLLVPGDFMDYVEDSGQIVGIGAWVLATACREAARFGPTAQMSVNVSARQLRHPLVVGDVADALARSGLLPQRLILEITETAAMSEAETETTIAKLTELKRLGVNVALDDFGTGYSPLSYLRRFPVDFLKIDRSFVRDIRNSREDESVVRGVIDMAHALGVQVVAEGIEDPAQLEVLDGLGCDLGQGYFWMRPAPLDAAVAWCALPRPRSAGGVQTLAFE